MSFEYVAPNFLTGRQRNGIGIFLCGETEAWVFSCILIIHLKLRQLRVLSTPDNLCGYWRNPRAISGDQRLLGIDSSFVHLTQLTTHNILLSDKNTRGDGRNDYSGYVEPEPVPLDGYH